MNTPLFSLMERIQAALEHQPSLTEAELEKLLVPGEDRALLDRTLAFLHGRDELMVDATGKTVHLRRRVTDGVIAAIQGANGGLTIDQLVRMLALAPAVCCDVLGWLEREGRVTIDADNRVTIR